MRLYIENIDMLSSQSQYQLWEQRSSAEGTRRNIRIMACLRESSGPGRGYEYIERYGSQRKAAAALGISHSALSIKLTKYYAGSSKNKPL